MIIVPQHRQGGRDLHSSTVMKNINNTLLHGGHTTITLSILYHHQHRYHLRREEILTKKQRLLLLVKEGVRMIVGIIGIIIEKIGTIVIVGNIAVGETERDVVQGPAPEIVIAGRARVPEIGRATIDGEEEEEETSRQAIVIITVVAVVMGKRREKEVAIARLAFCLLYYCNRVESRTPIVNLEN